MTSYYTLRVSRSDVTVPEKSKAPELYVKISFGDESYRTSSVNRLPPEWNETFPIACTCSDIETRFTIKLMKEGLIDTSIGSKECSLEELLRVNGENIRIPLQSKSGSYAIFLCLRPSDKMMNTELTLINLAHVLFDIHPSNYDFADNVNAIFDIAMSAAKTDGCQSLVNIGYKITAFVEFGDSIADANPYLKLTWCMTTAFLKIIATQTKTDKRVKDLVKDLMNLLLINKETSVFANPSESLLSVMTELLVFITQCSILLQDYARKGFIVRAILQNKKAAIDDLENTLDSLKVDLESAFKRQGIIEEQIRELRKELKEKLKPKHEGKPDRHSCLRGTRVEVLKEIEEWIHDTDAPNVLFILGRAGTGKSTIATTIAENYQRKGQLGSHQYFLRDKSDPAYIFRTIAYDLALRCQKTANAIDVQLDANDITTATPERAFEILLSDPLQEIIKEGKGKDEILIVLDALDECGSNESRGPYIRLIKEKLQTLPSNYRFLVTSRPEEDIASPEELKRLQLRHMNLDHESEDAKSDVLKYIRVELGKLRDDGRIEIEPEWPWEENMRILGDAADGLFIWAATAVRLVKYKKGKKEFELKRLVSVKSLSLANLYETALENSLDWDEETKIEFLKIFSMILFGKEQLTTTTFDTMLGYEPGTTKSILKSLRSIAAFGSGQPVRLYHTSLYDYLISNETRGKAWFIDQEKEKTHITLRCFKVMEILRFNICNLETSYLLNKDVPGLEKRVEDNISASLLYACRHWASHLREAPYSEDLCNQLEYFAFNQLLYWVEVLSLTGSLYDFLLQSLENAVTWIGNKHTKLSALLQDAQAQLLRFIEPISQSIPHLYVSFLPLMKEDSIVAEHYAKHAQSLTRVEYVGNKPRMACTRQIYVGNQVFSISYSPDGRRIVSGSLAGVVEVWDVVSGRRLLGTLQGHYGRVSSVAYSADGKYIASGSDDKTVRVWNAVTGESAYGPLTGHSDRITSVAFSGDGKFIASGSYDKTVRLWDAESHAPIGEPLRGHSEAVNSVMFSPNSSNGRYLASGSWEGTIILWDAESRKMHFDPFKGHSGTVFSLSFSLDSKRIVSGSAASIIHVWEVSTRNVLRSFSGDGMRGVNSVTYSGDSKHILSGSVDGIIRLWNAGDSDAPPRRFEGHTDRVWSVSFAPDSKHFASGSEDGTIRVWDVEKGVTLAESEVEGQAADIRTFAISPKTGKYLVSSSYDGTVCVWNTESGDLIKGPLKQSDSGTSAAFSPDENHFASGSIDGSIRIWNMIDDAFITCIGHTDDVLSLAFSPDGSRLASGSLDKSIRIWDVKRGSLKAKPLIGHTDWVSKVCYSPDGKKIVSGSRDNTVRIWDVSNSSLLSTFEGHSGWVNSVAYSPDGLYVVSASDDKTIRVWNTETGQAAYDPIIGHTNRVNSVCFSPDGKWIISGSADKTICVWNASTGVLFFQSRVSSEVNSVAAFPTFDNMHIKFASGSFDGVIHVWSINVESEGEKWWLEDDGWLTGRNKKLLMWIPPDLRRSLVYGPRTLNTRFSTSLDASLYRGDQWSVCFPTIAPA